MLVVPLRDHFQSNHGHHVLPTDHFVTFRLCSSDLSYSQHQLHLEGHLPSIPVDEEHALLNSSLRAICSCVDIRAMEHDVKAHDVN